MCFRSTYPRNGAWERSWQIELRGSPKLNNHFEDVGKVQRKKTVPTGIPLHPTCKHKGEESSASENEIPSTAEKQDTSLA